MKNKILVTLILMIALCTDINAQTKKPVRSAKPKPGKTEKTHPSVLPKDPDHGKGTPVGSLPVKKPVDAKKPRELEKSATVPAQDEQGGRQPGITTKDKQNGQPIPVDRAADRRAEDNKTLNQQSQAISPTQPQPQRPRPYPLPL